MSLSNIPEPMQYDNSPDNLPSNEGSNLFTVSASQPTQNTGISTSNRTASPAQIAGTSQQRVGTHRILCPVTGCPESLESSL